MKILIGLKKYFATSKRFWENYKEFPENYSGNFKLTLGKFQRIKKSLAQEVHQKRNISERRRKGCPLIKHEVCMKCKIL